MDDPALAEELAEGYRDIRRRLHVVYDDVRPALEILRQSYRLGLLTNGAADVQRAKIDGAGIGSYFDAIVVSGEVGVGKPDGRIFEIMTTRLAATCDAAWMIGDSLHSDVMGARAVGMKAVWINRMRKPRDASVVPDFEISGLVELRKILQNELAEEDR